MRGVTHMLVLLAAGAGLSLWGGCRDKGQATTQPAPGDPAVSKLIAPESLRWSRDEARAKLGDDKLGLSAALRLVRLAGVAALCVPEALTDNHVRRLRLVVLDSQHWALGLADKKDSQALRAAVLISADGDVQPLAEGVEEELLVLHVSKDADVFPHLATLPDRVLLIGEEIVPAIVLTADQKVRFELHSERGFGYVALVLAEGSPKAELARYRWDPYELTFLGPASDKLPDPPGGKFQIDLKASRRLVPVGGEIPPTQPNKPGPKSPQPPVADDDWLPA